MNHVFSCGTMRTSLGNAKTTLATGAASGEKVQKSGLHSSQAEVQEGRTGHRA